MFQSIGDADATITAAFLASPTAAARPVAALRVRPRTAHDDLSMLQAAVGSQADGSALAQPGRRAVRLQRLRRRDTAEYAMGYPLTGGSFLQDASEKAHLVLLPAANRSSPRRTPRSAPRAARRQGCPPRSPLLVLAWSPPSPLPGAAVADQAHQPRAQPRARPRVGAARHQRDLARGRIPVRPAPTSDRGIGHGSAPAQNLALASIGVQQIRGDAVLNVISRSGNTSFQDDFVATSKMVGPGPGSLARRRGRRAAGGGQGPRSSRRPERDATSWYAANTRCTCSHGGQLRRGAGAGRRLRQRQHGSPGTHALEVEIPRRSPPTRASSSPPPPEAPTRSTRWRAS